MTQKLEVVRDLKIWPVSSLYPLLGTAYRLPGYEIHYSSALTKTGKDYYASRPETGRMSTAAEELAIRAGTDPTRAEDFDDLFGRNYSHWRAWQWTSTGLRVPKGLDPDECEIDAESRRYWHREILIEDEVVGETLVPQGNGRVVEKWDGVFGLPRVADYFGPPRAPYVVFSRFNPNPDTDRQSGRKDVAVRLYVYQLPDRAGTCLSIDAGCARSSAHPNGGFRLVRGSLPKIEEIRS